MNNEKLVAYYTSFPKSQITSFGPGEFYIGGKLIGKDGNLEIKTEPLHDRILDWQDDLRSSGNRLEEVNERITKAVDAAAKAFSEWASQSALTIQSSGPSKVLDELEREERHAKAQRVWSSWSGKCE
jgi:hypothetical protein